MQTLRSGLTAGVAEGRRREPARRARRADVGGDVKEVVPTVA